AEVHAAADDSGIIVGRDDDDRHAGILRAQVKQARKPAYARHREVKQDEIHVTLLVEQLDHFVERSGLGNFGMRENARHRLPQRAAEQRMIISYDKAIVRVRHVASPVRSAASGAAADAKAIIAAPSPQRYAA